MEYSQLIQKILTAEENARAMAQTAREQQASLEADLERQAQQLRQDSLERAQRRLARLEQQERERAQAAMQAMDARHAAAMAGVERALEERGEQWVDELFRLVVDGT